jgi:hypothetical protein
MGGNDTELTHVQVGLTQEEHSMLKYCVVLTGSKEKRKVTSKEVLKHAIMQYCFTLLGVCSVEQATLITNVGDSND